LFMMVRSTPYRSPGRQPIAPFSAGCELEPEQCSVLPPNFPPPANTLGRQFCTAVGRHTHTRIRRTPVRQPVSQPVTHATERTRGGWGFLAASQRFARCTESCLVLSCLVSSWESCGVAPGGGCRFFSLTARLT
jgi:hypothetical protein